MYARQLLDGRARSLMVLQQVIQATRMQFVFDRAEPRRALGMPVTHLVEMAMGVRDECDGHGRLRLR
jgi:hypothetical protein